MGFSADWLALREPADLRARDEALLVAAIRASGSAPVIVDLGSGTGSTLRALGHKIAGSPKWRLVDSDANLLERASLISDAEISCHQIDLRRFDALPLEGVALVTASALLDLCSYDWVAALARHLAARSLPFYAALNYDGVMQWDAQDSDDEVIVEAFNRHQRRDKGFGPALGPDAARTVADIFAAEGYTVTAADSPWSLGMRDASLHNQLVDGIAQAALEAGAAGAIDWGARRKADARCHIGHRDVLALPRTSPRAHT